MPIDAIDHLTELLMSPELREHLIGMEELAPGLGFALRVSMSDSQPVVFANEAMPVQPGGVISGAEVLANLTNVARGVEMSILIHPEGGANRDKRNELILGALQVLNILDQEISVPVAA